MFGWPIQNRLELDTGSQYTMVSPSTQFTCDGEVTEWRFQARASNPLRAIVFRPIDGTTTQFKIIGFNDIPASEINTPILYTVPENERITVRQGDVIGFSYDQASLGFDKGGNTRLLYGRYLEITIDQIVDVARGPVKRSYSFQATVKPFISK